MGEDSLMWKRLGRSSLKTVLINIKKGWAKRRGPASSGRQYIPIS